MENQMNLTRTARQSGFGVPTDAGATGVVRPLVERYRDLARSGKATPVAHGVGMVDVVSIARPTTLGLSSSAPPIT